MNPLVQRIVRRSAMFVVALVFIAALWELYKVVGPEDGGALFGINILPRSNSRAMPHVWDMLSRYGRPELRSSERKIWRVVLAGAWFSFRLSLVGFAIGATVGVALATLMARFKVVERGLLPGLDREVGSCGRCWRVEGWSRCGRGAA